MQSMNSLSIDSFERSGQSASSGPKLSLAAQFDDMCRFANSLITIDEQSLIDLLRKCETNRIGWLSTKREFIEMKNRCKELEEKNKELFSNLKHVRYGFAKEVQNREKVIKERNGLANQLKAIKEFVLSETEPLTPPTGQKPLERVLSFINLNHLETVKEDTNESLEGVEYDVTEENVLMDSMPNNPPRRSSKRKSTEYELTHERTEYTNRREAKDMETDLERLAPRAVFEDNTDLDWPPAGDPPRRSLKLNDNPNKLDVISKSCPYISPNPNVCEDTNSGKVSPMFSMTPLEERKHNLHEKKAFISGPCVSCRQAIRFLSSYLICEDCRVKCHMNCKTELPMPCIPFRKPNGKSSQMVLIADFAPQSRPMIPALIIHCCTEIEKRGLQEEGIYRKCGSDKDIRELKNKILKPKNGIPALSGYAVHILCGVVKQFLGELDEPIVTRVLWRDFVRASDQENPDQEKALIMQTVEELPIANRDTLAFIMVHLNRVSQAKGNQMESRGLAKIFGPTIVGHSMIDPPMTEILAENPKQIKVMEALFRIAEQYWNGIVTTNMCDNNIYPFPDRRMMSHGRLMATVQRGALTPSRRDYSKGTLTLKPMF